MGNTNNQEWSWDDYDDIWEIYEYPTEAVSTIEIGG